MIKQVENQSKLHNFFLLVILNCNMSYLPQHNFKTLRKMQLIIGCKKLCLETNDPPLSPLAWLPKPYDDQHVLEKENPTLEPKAYL